VLPLEVSKDSTCARARTPNALQRARLSLTHSVRVVGARASLRFASLLPWSATQRLGRYLARVAIRFPGRARDSMLLNLSMCFPELDPLARGRLALESLTEAFRTMLELGPLWRWRRERVLGLVREVVGLERLEAALSSGRGVVLLGPHLGAWEMVGLYVSSRAAMTSLYRPPRVRRLDGLCRRARERFGARLVPADVSGVRELYRALRRGELVGVLPDQDPGNHAGVFAPFFGCPANTGTLAMRLLSSTEAVPLFAWAERLEHQRGYRLHFVAPQNEDMRHGEDLAGAARSLNLELERLIRERPQQYLWSYQRFRSRPAGQPNPYRREHRRAVASGARVADGFGEDLADGSLRDRPAR